MCKKFYKDVTKFTDFKLFLSAQRFRFIHSNTYALVRAERHDQPPVSFVHSAKRVAYLCNDIMTSAILSTNPKLCVSICSWDIATVLNLYSNCLRSRYISKNDRMNMLLSLRRGFNRNFTRKDTNMDTVLVPLKPLIEHSGVLVGKRFVRNARYTLWFGDNLGWKYQSMS